MQINVPPGARILIETQDAPIVLAAQAPVRSHRTVIVIAIVAFVAGAAVSHLPSRAPAEAVSQPAAALSLQPHPAQPPPAEAMRGQAAPPADPRGQAQANPFGLKP
jgi:hypothetical protein